MGPLCTFQSIHRHSRANSCAIVSDGRARMSSIPACNEASHQHAMSQAISMPSASLVIRRFEDVAHAADEPPAITCNHMPSVAIRGNPWHIPRMNASRDPYESAELSILPVRGSRCGEHLHAGGPGAL